MLLRKADIRFERGHRYGLIGQNGTGKTTLLNRLAAKDITGFPTELRTFYIRHEVLCDDGVVVKVRRVEREHVLVRVNPHPDPTLNYLTTSSRTLTLPLTLTLTRTSSSSTRPPRRP